MENVLVVISVFLQYFLLISSIVLEACNLNLPFSQGMHSFLHSILKYLPHIHHVTDTHYNIIPHNTI